MAGVSDNENKDAAAKWIKSLRPKTVLDVGAGMGIYSIMAKKRGQHWTALEVFAPYVNMFNLQSRYEQIIIADARYVNYDKLGMFDLSIAADMLEHMPKHHAIEVLFNLYDHSKHLLVCFPTVHHEQHAGFEGNEFETHIDHWTVEEMSALLDKHDVEYKTVIGDVLAYYFIKGKLCE